MRVKIVLRILLLMLVGSILNGCVLLRIFEVKNQVSSFDENFSIEKDNGLVVSFHDPAILEKDVRWLGFYPASVEKSGDTTILVHQLKKKLKADDKESGDFDLSMRSFFKEGKLEKIVLPERFFSLIPGNISALAVQWIDGARVDAAERKISLGVTSADIDGEFPGKEEVLKLIGVPSSTTLTGDGEQYTYLFELVMGEDEELKKPANEMIFSVNFSKGGEILDFFLTIPRWGVVRIEVD